MTRFVGGPYDGDDLPLNPVVVRKIRLPDPNSIEGMLVDSLLKETNTNDRMEWPHRYEADLSTQPAVYRFVNTSDK